MYGNALKYEGKVTASHLVEMIIDTAQGLKLLEFSVLANDVAERVAKRTALGWRTRYGTSVAVAGSVVWFSASVLIVSVRIGRQGEFTDVPNGCYANIGHGLLVTNTSVVRAAVEMKEG